MRPGAGVLGELTSSQPELCRETPRITAPHKRQPYMDEDSTTTLRRTLWDGHIPCRLTLSPSESRLFDQTSPYFVCCALLHMWAGHC